LLGGEGQRAEEGCRSPAPAAGPRAGQESEERRQRIDEDGAGQGDIERGERDDQDRQRRDAVVPVQSPAQRPERGQAEDAGIESGQAGGPFAGIGEELEAQRRGEEGQRRLVHRLAEQERVVFMADLAGERGVQGFVDVKRGVRPGQGRPHDRSQEDEGDGEGQTAEEIGAGPQGPVHQSVKR